MAFTLEETSNDRGQPVGLYEFQYGNTYWRYCTADEDQVVGFDENGNPATWLAKAITDDGVTQGGGDQNDLTIQLAANLPVGALFRAGKPTGRVWLRVRHWHVGDAADETPLAWSGSVTNGTLVDLATIQLACRSLGGTYDRNGLRLAWARMCPHPLYGVGCYVKKDLHAYPRTIDELTPVSFTCTAHSEPEEGSFSAGFVEWERADGSFDRRGIERQDGNHFQVLGSTAGLEEGMAVTLYPGCARNTANCKLFDNLPNYGGFPHLPGKSPFDGTPVF